MKEKRIVICDIDGTIADNSHRQHYLLGKKDWKKFFRLQKYTGEYYWFIP